MSGRVVDAHVHLWSLAARPQPWIPAGDVLDRDFALPDLVAATTSAGVSSVVLVQVLNQADETEEYLATAAGSDLVAAVVGWVDLAVTGSFAGLAGVRHQALAEADPAAWVRRHDVRAGMAHLGRLGLACDLMLRTEHLAAAQETAAGLPEVRFVLDHAGKPPIATGWGSPDSAAWATAVGSLARRPNVLAKLSGLTTMAAPGWTADDLRPWVEHLLTAFGPERLVFGSDWPVSLRAGSYERTVSTTRELLADLTTAERDAVLGGNAVEVYGLR